MEGACPDIPGALAEQLFQTGLELSRRLVGKRDGQDLPGRNGIERRCLIGQRAVFFQLGNHLFRGEGRKNIRAGGGTVLQEIVDPVDEHAGFAAARAGEDQKRPLRMDDGLLLHGIEMRESAPDIISPRLKKAG